VQNTGRCKTPEGFPESIEDFSEEISKKRFRRRNLAEETVANPCSKPLDEAFRVSQVTGFGLI